LVETPPVRSIKQNRGRKERLNQCSQEVKIGRENRGKPRKLGRKGPRKRNRRCKTEKDGITTHTEKAERRRFWCVPCPMGRGDVDADSTVKDTTWNTRALKQGRGGENPTAKKAKKQRKKAVPGGTLKTETLANYSWDPKRNHR